MRDRIISKKRNEPSERETKSFEERLPEGQYAVAVKIPKKVGGVLKSNKIITKTIILFSIP